MDSSGMRTAKPGGQSEQAQKKGASPGKDGLKSLNGQEGTLVGAKFTQEQLEIDGWTRICLFEKISVIFGKDFNKRLVWNTLTQTVSFQYEV